MAQPILDSNGYAYVVDKDGRGFATVGKSVDGNYMVGDSRRLATREEVDSIIKPVMGNIGANVPAITPTPGYTAPSYMPPSTTPTASASSATAPTADVTSYINQLKQAQLNNRISALDKAQNAPLSGLTSEQASIEPAYYNKRNQAAGASEVSGMNFAQYMASRGIKGAAGAMPEIYRNAGLQQQIGSLDQQETAAKTDIARRKSDIENAYQSDVAGTNADVETSAMQNMIDAYNAKQAQAAADNAAMGLTSTGQQTLQGQEYENNQADKVKQDYVNTIGQYSDNYQAEINAITNDNDTSNDWKLPYLKTARAEKIAAQSAALVEAQREKSAADQAAYDRALKTWQASGVATSDIAAILGVPVGAKTASYNIDALNAATSARNADTSRINANKSGSSGTSKTEQTNADFANDYNNLKALPVASAVKAMNDRWGDMIAQYGADGAKKLWNTVLAEAINMGQAAKK